MSETQSVKSEVTVFYEGLELVLVNRVFEDGNKEFDVQLRPDNYDPSKDDTLAEATCSEGYTLGFNQENKRVDESEVLGIEEVYNYEAPKGTGTKLIKFCLEEGQRRGFSVVRVHILNPAIIKIIENLTNEGSVKARHYFLDNRSSPQLSIPTTDLPKCPEFTPEEGIKYLGQRKNSEDSSEESLAVDCIISI